MLIRRVKAGNEFDICAMEDGGRCEIIDFMTELRASNVKEFEKLVKLIDTTADVGKLRNEEKFKLLEDGIY